MKNLFRSLWLLISGMASISMFVTPCFAQQPTPTPTPIPTSHKVKVKASAPPIGQIPVVFSVSTSGDGSALGRSGDYLPSGADVDPQTKDYYIEVEASVTLPADMDASVLPNTIRIQARRILYNTTSSGVRSKTYTGDTLDLITLQQANSAPSAQNQRIYYYDRYPPSPYNTVEELETARVENDWNVSKVKGRWEVRVHPDDGPSNLVEVKINKRAQITTTALDWANFWPTTQPRNDDLKAAWYPPDSGTYFGDCGGFVSYVYDRHGLEISSAFGSAEQQSSVLDSGAGSLRFFYNGPNGNANVLHVGILVSSNQVVDNNNAVYALSDRGVYLHGKGDGMNAAWPFNHQYDSAQEKTLKGELNPSTSILQELDAQ